MQAPFSWRAKFQRGQTAAGQTWSPEPRFDAVPFSGEHAPPWPRERLNNHVHYHGQLCSRACRQKDLRTRVSHRYGPGQGKMLRRNFCGDSGAVGDMLSSQKLLLSILCPALGGGTFACKEGPWQTSGPRICGESDDLPRAPFRSLQEDPIICTIWDCRSASKERSI